MFDSAPGHHSTFAANKRRWRNGKHTRNRIQSLAKYAFPVLGDMRVHRIGRQELLRPLDYRSDLLERAVVESADTHRTCGGWSATRKTLTGDGSLDVVHDGDEYREVQPGEKPEGTLRFGPGPVGGFVSFALNPDQVVPGASAAPDVARAFRFADRRLGTDFGQLTAAHDVRS